MANETEERYEEAVSDSSGPDLAQALGGGSEEPYIGEEKKPANKNMMVLVGVALVGVAVVYFMYFKKGPETAGAATQANQADQTITQFLSDGTRNIQQMEQMLRETEKVVEQFRTYPSMAQKPLSELRTNPFRFHDEAGVPEDAEMAKRKREEERAAALKAVSGLALQSIMHSGSHKACMINNQLYKEGQQIKEFTIDRISPDSVIVRTGAYRFELKMQ
jgi:hypothetical protein